MIQAEDKIEFLAVIREVILSSQVVQPKEHLYFLCSNDNTIKV